MKTSNLSNGLTVILCDRPGCRSVAMSFRVRAGSIYEHAHETGVAHFLEHVAMDGSRRYPNERKLSDVIDLHGGIKNAVTNKDTIEYYVKVLKGDESFALEYLSQIVCESLISKESITKQKGIIEQEISRFKSDPERLSQRAVYSVVFPGTRLGSFNTGDVDDIRSLRWETVVAYAQVTHCGNNSVLVVCGDLKSSNIESLIQTYFGALPPGQTMSVPDIKATPLANPVTMHLNGAKQTVISAGFQAFPTGDIRRYAVDVLRYILCAPTSGRLSYEIRERQSMAYSIAGNSYHGRAAGALMIHAGVSPERVDDCIATMTNEFAKLSQTVPDSIELDRSYASIKARKAFLLEDTLGEASYHSYQWCTTDTTKTVEAELDAYKAVCADNECIRNTASSLFKDPPAILLVGP